MKTVKLILELGEKEYHLIKEWIEIKRNTESVSINKQEGKRDDVKIKKLIIKESESFEPCEVFFNNDFTIIEGGNGSGKTALFNTLRDTMAYNKNYGIEFEGKYKIKDLKWFFLDLRKLSEALMLRKKKKFADTEYMELINYNFQEEIDDYGLDQFSRIIRDVFKNIFSCTLFERYFIYDIKINKQNEILFTDKKGITFSLHKCSEEKRLFISFLMALAVREIKNIKGPIVLDNPLAKSELLVLKEFYLSLQRIHTQVIVMSGTVIIAGLGFTADCELGFQNTWNKTVILGQNKGKIENGNKY